MSVSKGQNRLSGNEALELWKKGYVAWNEWIASVDNPHVDFSGLTFEPNIQDKYGERFISFNKYKLPNNITFRNVVFHSGHLAFSNLDSPEASIHFEDCTIQCHRVSINNSNLSMVYFNNVLNATCRFHIVDSKIKYLRLTNCKISNGFFQISGLKMRDANLDFRSNEFDNCNLSLINSDLPSGNMIFSSIVMKGGSFIIDNNKCDNSVFSLLMNDLSCPLKVTNMSNLKRLDLQGTSVNSFVKLANISLNSVVDLTGTKFSNSIVIYNLTNKLNRTRKFKRFFLSIADDKEDFYRFRRLKEIAELTKDNELALSYFSSEKKCQRWVRQGVFNSLIDVFYSAISNYGQSIFRPLLTWIISVPLFSILYLSVFSKNPFKEIGLIDASMISIKNSVPFLGLFRMHAVEFQSIIYSDLTLLSLAITQGVLSVILTFLVGLGLRNNFRI